MLSVPPRSPFQYLRWSRERAAIEVIATEAWCMTVTTTQPAPGAANPFRSTQSVAVLVTLVSVDGITSQEIASCAVALDGPTALTERLPERFPVYISALASSKGTASFITTGVAQVTVDSPFSPGQRETRLLQATPEIYAAAIAGSPNPPCTTTLSTPAPPPASVFPAAFYPPPLAPASLSVAPSMQPHAAPSSGCPRIRVDAPLNGFPNHGGLFSVVNMQLPTASVVGRPWEPVPCALMATAPTHHTPADPSGGAWPSYPSQYNTQCLALPAPAPPMLPVQRTGCPQLQSHAKEAERSQTQPRITTGDGDRGAQQMRGVRAAVNVVDAAAAHSMNRAPLVSAALTNGVYLDTFLATAHVPKARVSPFTAMRFDAAQQRLFVYAPEVRSMHYYLVSIDGVSAAELHPLFLAYAAATSRENSTLQDTTPAAASGTRPPPTDFFGDWVEHLVKRGGYPEACFTRTGLAHVVVQAKGYMDRKEMVLKATEERYAECQRQCRLLATVADPTHDTNVAPGIADEGHREGQSSASPVLPFTYIAYDDVWNAFRVLVPEVEDTNLQLISVNHIDAPHLIREIVHGGRGAGGSDDDADDSSSDNPNHSAASVTRGEAVAKRPATVRRPGSLVAGFAAALAAQPPTRVEGVVGMHSAHPHVAYVVLRHLDSNHVVRLLVPASTARYNLACRLEQRECAELRNLSVISPYSSGTLSASATRMRKPSLSSRSLSQRTNTISESNVRLGDEDADAARVLAGVTAGEDHDIGDLLFSPPCREGADGGAAPRSPFSDVRAEFGRKLFARAPEVAGGSKWFTVTTIDHVSATELIEHVRGQYGERSLVEGFAAHFPRYLAEAASAAHRDPTRKLEAATEGIATDTKHIVEVPRFSLPRYIPTTAPANPLVATVTCFPKNRGGKKSLYFAIEASRHESACVNEAHRAAAALVRENLMRVAVVEGALMKC